MAINPYIALNPNRPVDPLTAFSMGRDKKRAREREDEFMEMAREDREVQREDRESLKEQRRAESARLSQEQELKSMVRGAIEVLPALDGVEGVPRAMNILNARIEEIESRGGNSTESRFVRDLIRSGRIDEAKQQLQTVLEVGERFGVVEPSPKAEATDDIREYNQAVQQGYAGTFRDYMLEQKQAGAARTTIKNEAPVPAGFQAVRDQGGNLERYDPVPGGPAAREIEAQEETAKSAAAERNEAAELAKSVMDNPNLGRAYGAVQGRTASFRQGTIDVEADVDRLVAILSLENREKMKGSGQVSDFESRLLGKSATVLENKLISDKRAKEEIKRIHTVLSDGVTPAPPEAEAMLKQNPELADQFEEKYGYLPEGF